MAKESDEYTTPAATPPPILSLRTKFDRIKDAVKEKRRQREKDKVECEKKEKSREKVEKVRLYLHFSTGYCHV